MKKLFLTFVFAIVATLAAMAQQISVVSTTGATTLYRTLQEAIEGADPGSVIYLPGGGFSISDDVKITKKLTIIGIGHKSNNDNVDGITTISGSLWFNGGSSGSAVLGCYITGNINIGDGEATVADMLIRYCNVSSVQVKNRTCLGTIINQNYIRSGSNFSNCSCTFSNNITGHVHNMNDGIICNNVFIQNNGYFTFWDVNNATIRDNVFIVWQGTNECREISAFHNMFIGSEWGDCINLSDVNWSDIFIKNNGIVPTSNYHFKESYKQYEGLYGIYSGSGFNDNQLAPVPYIVAKHVDEQTDASGKLNVKIRVKASGEE